MPELARFARTLLVSFLAALGVGLIVWLVSTRDGDPNAEAWGYTAHLLTLALMTAAQRFAEIYAPQVVTHVHKVTESEPQPAPRTIQQLPPQGYQTVAHFEDYKDWPDVRYDRLYRALQFILAHGPESVSVDKLRGVGINEGEAAALRAWFKRLGVGEDHRRGIILTGEWQTVIEARLPHARNLKAAAAVYRKTDS